MVAEKCINPLSKRPVTIGVVERALGARFLSSAFHNLMDGGRGG